MSDSETQDSGVMGTPMITNYFNYVQDTEPPWQYHRWSLISAVSALLGRNVYLEFGASDNIYPNQYVCIIGPAGGRKTTAISIAGKLLKAAGFNKFASDKSSKEKFIADLAAGFSQLEYNKEVDPIDLESMDIFNDVSDVSDVFIKAGELQDTLGSNNGDFLSWLTNMWDNLDEYKHRTKHSDSVVITKPTINLLGAATQTTFQAIFTTDSLGTGMLSRMMLVSGQGARKRIAFPQEPDPILKAELVTHLQEIKQLRGAVTLTTAARDLMERIYNSKPQLEDTRFASYLARRFTHLIKLCMVLAAMQLSTTITSDIVTEANTILAYTEASMPAALGDFGQTVDGSRLEAVLLEIRAKGLEGVTIASLFLATAAYTHDMNQLLQTVDKLTKAGKVKQLKGLGKNKPARYYPVVNEIELSDKYINSDYLIETKEK